MIKHIFTVFILSLLFSSCITSKRLNYLQEPGLIIPSYPKDSTALSDYKLQVGDKVIVRLSAIDKSSLALFGGDQQSMMASGSDLYSYTIYADSCIDFPFVGSIHLAGLTTRAAKDTVITKLKPFVPQCDAEVRLVNSFFTIVGDANNGKFPIPKEKLNIFQVLSISGGLSTVSDRAKIHILRPTSKGTQIKVFDIRSKDIINSEFYYIRPNDVIYVQSFNGQFFKIESFSSILSTITTTLSFGYLVYNFSTK